MTGFIFSLVQPRPLQQAALVRLHDDIHQQLQQDERGIDSWQLSFFGILSRFPADGDLTHFRHRLSFDVRGTSDTEREGAVNDFRF